MASDTVAAPPSRVLRSPGLKILIVALLTIAMAIPLLFIQLALVATMYVTRKIDWYRTTDLAAT